MTRILVVDDEPQILRTLRINLRARDYDVWGPTYTKETHYLRQYMAQLRRKLEDDPAHPQHLLTEPGMGYRLYLPSQAAQAEP